MPWQALESGSDAPRAPSGLGSPAAIGRPNPSRIDWDDLRFFHAVAREGSLSRAAAALSVTQPTVGRRIRMLEQRLETRLFDRLTLGYRLTESGKRVFARAEELAKTVGAIAEEAAGEAAAARGPVRVTTSVGVGVYWLAPRLASLHQRHPGLTVEMEIATARRDLGAGEAEVALRLGAPGSDELIGRVVANIPFHLYGSQAYFASHGVPMHSEDLRRHLIIESVGALEALPQASLLRRLSGDAPASAAFDSILAQAAAVAAGTGLVSLPCYLAANTPGLRQALPEDFQLSLPLRVLTRRDLVRAPHVRAVMDFIAAEAKASLPQ
jgi:DNA-binding transcriptional LysR family regulator